MIDLTKEWSITLNDRVVYEKVDIIILPNNMLMVLHQDIEKPLMFRESDCVANDFTYLGELDEDGDSMIDEEFELQEYSEVAKKAKKKVSGYNATLNSLAKIVEKII
jgi:hypothetical protein